MRLRDYRCRQCGKVERDVVEAGGHVDVPRCHGMMHELIGAPMVFYRPQYSHALGRKVTSSVELDKELAKKGEWIASKNEANSSYNTDIFTDNVTFKKANDAKIKKHVEKTAAKLVADGVIPALSR